MIPHFSKFFDDDLVRQGFDIICAAVAVVLLAGGGILCLIWWLA